MNLPPPFDAHMKSTYKLYHHLPSLSSLCPFAAPFPHEQKKRAQNKRQNNRAQCIGNEPRQKPVSWPITAAGAAIKSTERGKYGGQQQGLGVAAGALQWGRVALVKINQAFSETNKILSALCQRSNSIHFKVL
ncbi:hypothetical protein ACLKA7_013279 [Drosophila subpalustris]